MIEIKNIHKSFGDNEVLQGISGKFEEGITNLIIGGSGSGKTTLLKCMIGLHQPEQGEVFYEKKCWNCPGNCHEPKILILR
jgi:phospholipid/cholesterol/gamma-HCH transport system ATP-binding protein